MKAIINILSIILWITGAIAGPLDNPLATKEDLFGGYLGSFRFILNAGGEDTTAYQRGRIAVNAGATRFYSDSHVYSQKVAEFSFPTLSSGEPLTLALAPSTQGYASVFNRTDTADPGIDWFGGMAVIDGQLVIHGADFYDTNDTPETTAVIRDVTNLAGSVDGYFEMPGAARLVGYISPIPEEWQAILGGTHIAGNGLNMSISARLSVGPSLYTFDKADLVGRTSGVVPTTEWMSYDNDHALSITTHPYPANTWDAYNQQGVDSGFTQNNDLWTYTSYASYGFIIPGTRTFAVIGSLGCLTSGGGYFQNDPSGCSGSCANDQMDYHPYYWLYDLADIVNATNKYDPIPYDYGLFDQTYPKTLPDKGVGLPSAASYDPTTGKLFMVIRKAYRDGDAYPIVNVYQVGSGSPPPTSGNKRMIFGTSKITNWQ